MHPVMRYCRSRHARGLAVHEARCAALQQPKLEQENTDQGGSYAADGHESMRVRWLAFSLRKRHANAQSGMRAAAVGDYLTRQRALDRFASPYTSMTIELRTRTSATLTSITA